MVMKIERGDKGDGRGRGSGVASFSSSLTACPFILVLKMLVILKLFFFLNTHLHLNWQVAFSYINLHGRLIKCRAAMSGREREKDRN